MMEKPSPDQSKKLWLPIKFLLDKIDDVSCIPLEKCDTFRTHAFARLGSRVWNMLALPVRCVRKRLMLSVRSRAVRAASART